MYFTKAGASTRWLWHTTFHRRTRSQSLVWVILIACQQRIMDRSIRCRYVSSLSSIYTLHPRVKFVHTRHGSARCSMRACMRVNCGSCLIRVNGALPWVMPFPHITRFLFQRESTLCSCKWVYVLSYITSLSSCIDIDMRKCCDLSEHMQWMQNLFI